MAHFFFKIFYVSRPFRAWTIMAHHKFLFYIDLSKVCPFSTPTFSFHHLFGPQLSPVCFAFLMGTWPIG